MHHSILPGGQFCHLLLGATLLTACAAGSLLAADPAARGPDHMGIMVGEVTATTAVAQVRLIEPQRSSRRKVPGMAGTVRFELVSEDGQAVAAQSADAKADADFIARVAWSELSPAVRYTLKTQIGASADALRPGPSATFRTLAGPDVPRPTSFVVVTGMNYAKFHGDDRIDRKQHLIQNNTELPRPYDGPDKKLGYPALATIRKLQVDFFIGTGDNVYYDTPRDPRAETLAQMRQKWNEQFVQPRYQEMFAVVPTYWMIDDHDYRVDDCDNSGDYDPSPQLGRRVMLEQLPLAVGPKHGVKTYRTHRVNEDLQIWLPENRMYRSPNATPDGPDKTIWGAEQKAWLQRTLEASDATFKLLISPTPMIGPDDKRKTDNHTDIGGFQHERDEFFAWLKETGIADRNFYIVCGDRHWQYHSIDPSGLEEFSCGALVDANARLGRKPGDPESTDPEALIKQPYTQKVASGGFLLIEVFPAEGGAPATLGFKFHDEHGKLLHEVSKRNTL